MILPGMGLVHLFMVLVLVNGHSRQTPQTSKKLSFHKLRSVQPTASRIEENDFHIRYTKSRSEKTKQFSRWQLTNRMRMYLGCAAITFIWISTGTLFYAKYYGWPLSQSFFYAVDAGMSIGFCTDVAETRVGSRAFTIVYILLGASCVGGALALFIKDIVEGVVDLKHGKYEELLARNAVLRADVDHSGNLSYCQFRSLVNEWSSSSKNISDDDFEKLCQKFDASNRGYVDYEVFLTHYDKMDQLLQISGHLYSENKIVRGLAQLGKKCMNLWRGSNRIFTVFFLWVILGVSYGKFAMGWDTITATHFAISALATGGLTAPSVDSDGILPTGPALFCGFYCLFGIPLFALTLGYFAKILVERHYVNAEESTMMEPISLTEYQYAKHLTSDDSVIHLSDFIVLQLLRQRKVNMEMVDMIKARFQSLDVDNSGFLTYEQATEMSRKEL